MRLPVWPPRDWRALLALAASVAGAGVLTGVSVWVVHLIATMPKTDAERLLALRALANSNYGLLGIIGAVLLSLGLAINRRTLKANLGKSGFDFSGGDEPVAAPAAAQAVAEAAADKAADIVGGARP